MNSSGPIMRSSSIIMGPVLDYQLQRKSQQYITRQYRSKVNLAKVPAFQLSSSLCRILEKIPVDYGWGDFLFMQPYSKTNTKLQFYNLQNADLKTNMAPIFFGAIFKDPKI